MADEATTSAPTSIMEAIHGATPAVQSKSSPSIGKIILALSKAQNSFEGIAKDKTVKVQTKTGGSYTFEYSTLDAIIKATKKGLADNELGHTSIMDDTHITTILAHSSGEFLSSSVKISSLVKAGDNNAQAYGSAISYGRRYLLSGLLGIVSEEDDDGNSASGNSVEDRTGRSAPSAPSSARATTPLAKSTSAPITDKQLEFAKRILSELRGEKNDAEFVDATKKLISKALDANLSEEMQAATTIDVLLGLLKLKQAEVVLDFAVKIKQQKKAEKAAAEAPAEPTDDAPAPAAE